MKKFNEDVDQWFDLVADAAKSGRNAGPIRDLLGIAKLEPGLKHFDLFMRTIPNALRRDMPWVPPLRAMGDAIDRSQYSGEFKDKASAIRELFSMFRQAASYSANGRAHRPNTVRLEKKWKIGDRGAVYEFNVKSSMALRGVNISDEEFAEEAAVAVRVFAEFLRKQYSWVGRVYLTGRSNGWLAIEDKTGRATAQQLETIDEVHIDEAQNDFETALIESFGYTKNPPRQQSLRGAAFVDPKLRKAYDFFREHAGGIVGESAKGAVNLARAEKYAEDHGWEAVWEEDPDEYQLGDAETERPFEVLNCVLKDENGEVLASLGSIGMSGNNRQDRDYRRLVEAELALEAMP